MTREEVEKELMTENPNLFCTPPSVDDLYLLTPRGTDELWSKWVYDRVARREAEAREQDLIISNAKLAETITVLRTPCKCDPIGSGEEYCNGGCELRARVVELEAENARLKEQVKWRPTPLPKGKGIKQAVTGTDFVFRWRDGKIEWLPLPIPPLPKEEK